MRGLPFSATAEEVLDFFGRPSALQPSNIHLMRRSDGRASGDAYVVFDNEEAAVEMLKLDKKKLGTRWLTGRQRFWIQSFTSPASGRHSLPDCIHQVLRWSTKRHCC
jgi:hypothetical protein